MGGVIGLDLRAPYVLLDQIKAGIAELKSLRPYWTGDYFPLAEIISTSTPGRDGSFTGRTWKRDLPILFRRSLSTESSFQAKLRGIDPSASYNVTFAWTYEVTEKRTMTGQQLKNLRVEIHTAPGSVLIRFQTRGLREP